MMLLEKREQKRETEATAIVNLWADSLGRLGTLEKRQAQIWLSSHSFQTIFSGVRATQKKAEQQNWESWSLDRAVRFCSSVCNARTLSMSLANSKRDSAQAMGREAA
jgi:anti-sigma-K factor RskA